MTQRILIRHIDGRSANQVDQFPVGSFEEIIAGRDESASVRFDPEQDDLVSRLHLKILADPSAPSGFHLIDLQSRNGTYLKGQRIFGATPLSHNDIIQLGPGGPQICFELDPPPPPPIKTTREVSIFDDAPSSRAVPTRILGLDVAPTTLSGDPIPVPRPIGRATVERMLDDTFDKVKHESNKSVWVGLVAVGVVVAASVIGFVLVRKNSVQSADSARQQQTILQGMDEAVKQSPQQEAAMRDQIVQLNTEIKKLEDRDSKDSAALKQMLQERREDSQSDAQAESSAPAVVKEPAQLTPHQATTAPSATSPVATGPSYDQAVKNVLDLLKANQVQPAMQAAAQLISQYPNRWESYGVAGTVLRSQSKLPEAKLAYQRALELAPNEVKPQIASAIQQIDTKAAANKPATP